MPLDLNHAAFNLHNCNTNYEDEPPIYRNVEISFVIETAIQQQQKTEIAYKYLIQNVYQIT